MQSTKPNPSNTSRNIWPKLITFVFILLTIVAAVMLLPRGFSQDVSQIGKGTNAVVLVHDNNIIQSGETMAAMNEIRDIYTARIEFIIADIKTPSGKAFADTYALSPTALTFFSADGEKLQTLYSPQTGETLKNNLNTIFKY
ncbi:hypothetical protein SAMN05216419_100541 [Nitrosomonas cryotolerans]|uniref:Uncharacterized protein n=1 Tax=Nitrosomonas cryotolerans ATCC 49181 TaxID=1131553 RepID=A0A1N6G6B8_9PROT|nr:hypothetical protein [Nitrosomonas cryotolerans]SFP51941.1 hypothetical protein SAMN05216419_100541 [Nitrosomonas cryotolerans]SIO03058.1 hypothetical protein SAMN02743940_0572 [Nitrosomonas cryotolerans ATCC 49181]